MSNSIKSQKYKIEDFEIKDGYYGSNKDFGGQYMPEILLPALQELEKAFYKYKDDSDFLKELNYYQTRLNNRPSPLIYIKNLTEKLGGAKIYLKNEGANFTGSHKINHCLYHALLAKRMGKKEIIAETGAGQHGFAVATVCSIFNLKAKIFMGQKSIDRQYPNVFWMKQLGAEVIPVLTGGQKLTDAGDAAMGEWMTNPDSYYMLGSVIGPHPFPEIIRQAQKIIGQEIKNQLREIENNPEILPNKIVACIGGGSNAIGAFNSFLADQEVELIGVEAGGSGVDKEGQHAARISSGKATVGIFEGFKSYFLLNKNGGLDPTGGISAGLDYVGIGPIHSYLYSIGRLKLTYATDKEVMEAFGLLARNEGIIAALESCHALVEGFKQAKKMSKNEILIINLSGRADNYLFNVASGVGDEDFKKFCSKVGSIN
jgi:tryptophan synthase beta chain